jgi:hypothetical protein
VGKDINFDASHLSDDDMEAESNEAISLGEEKRNYLCSNKSATSENFTPSLCSFLPKSEAPDSFLQAGAHQFLGNIAKELCTNLTSSETTTLTSSLNDPVIVAVVHHLLEG